MNIFRGRNESDRRKPSPGGQPERRRLRHPEQRMAGKSSAAWRASRSIATLPDRLEGTAADEWRARRIRRGVHVDFTAGGRSAIVAAEAPPYGIIMQRLSDGRRILSLGKSASLGERDPTQRSSMAASEDAYGRATA
jgi:hypothetical protein